LAEGGGCGGGAELFQWWREGENAEHIGGNVLMISNRNSLAMFSNYLLIKNVKLMAYFFRIQSYSAYLSLLPLLGGLLNSYTKI
jgi:hypothetical protein